MGPGLQGPTALLGVERGEPGAEGQGRFGAVCEGLLEQEQLLRGRSLVKWRVL